MTKKFEFIHLFLLIKQIKPNYLRNNEETDFFEENIGLFIILIIMIIILISLIIFLLFTIYKKYKKRKNQNLNNHINEERPSQKYKSEYDTKRKKHKKFNYKERILEKEET